MNITTHFTLEELIRSSVATEKRINNTPTRAEIEWLRYGCTHVLEPLRAKVGHPLIVTSGFRSVKLNVAVGGVSNSQHVIGQAADLHVQSQQDAMLMFSVLAKNKHVDQLLFEHSKNTQWLHVSWSVSPRQFFRKNYQV